MKELPHLDFDLEQLATGENGFQWAGIIGVDEAGRGPLAGPVVASAIHLCRDFYANCQSLPHIELFNDSKQLSERQREMLFGLINEWQVAGYLCVGVGEGSVADIEALNILGATAKAMSSAIAELYPNNNDNLILIDGRAHKKFAYKHRGIIKGDTKSLAIAMASIVAKVTRDRQMLVLDELYPQYGFKKHKGYGTEQHRKAIREHGACAEHRPLFLRKVL